MRVIILAWAACLAWILILKARIRQLRRQAPELFPALPVPTPRPIEHSFRGCGCGGDRETRYEHSFDCKGWWPGDANEHDAWRRGQI
jgi:hypothetical protein